MLTYKYHVPPESSPVFPRHQGTLFSLAESEKALSSAWNGHKLSIREAMAAVCHPSLADLGHVVNKITQEKCNNIVYYNTNRHINPTNICALRCHFCAFARRPGEEGGYEFSLEEIAEKAKAANESGATEVHVTGGLHPNWTLQNYLDVLETIKSNAPSIALKAFTAIEIDWLAYKNGMKVEEVLERLAKSGLVSLTGGGAEIFDPAVRKVICPGKPTAEKWLNVHRAAHRIGIRSTCTMLFGHLEDLEARANHLAMLNDLQAETGGFTAFVPLSIQTGHKPFGISRDHPPEDELRTIALSRLLLDKFTNIKAYWIMLGLDTATMAFHFGANDIDGTVEEEKIANMAGSSAGVKQTCDKLVRVIKQADRIPVERTTLYEHRFADTKQTLPNAGTEKKPRAVESRLTHTGKRLSGDEALRMLRECTLTELGAMANDARLKWGHGNRVGYAIDTNVNHTNICEVACKFCAFATWPQAPNAYTLTFEEILTKISDAVTKGATGVLFQGGVNRSLPVSWYEDLFSKIKDQFPKVHLHALSVVELQYLAKFSELSLPELVSRLKKAGMDSVPGAGAEILSNEVRSIISPRKGSADDWIDTMRVLHQANLPTSATMMFGTIESDRHIVEHLLRLRDLQDETNGFFAFIPWSYQSENTPLSKDQNHAADHDTSPTRYLKILALSRLVLDNFKNIQSSWLTTGKRVGQIGLSFGANDLGSIMLEENVVKAAGVSDRHSVHSIRATIEASGFEPFQRDTYYQPVENPFLPNDAELDG